MAYLEQSSRPSPASMAAVIGVHAGIAGLLLIGLNVTGIVQIADGPITSITPYTPPPPPLPDGSSKPKPDPADTKVFTPIPPLPIPPRENAVETTVVLPPPGPIIRDPTPRPVPDVSPSTTPTPSFAPIAAKPRNDPGGWLSEADYRPSWISREMVGRARFRLEIAANGKVTGCTITGSTGHSQLDQATCALVTRRARFEPARGTEGEPVAGSYSSSVDWRLPE